MILSYKKYTDTKKNNKNNKNNITTNDYKHILKYYKLSIPKTKKKIKRKAEKILNTKLCACIKAVTLKARPKSNSENKSIAICTNSIINRKNLKLHNFTCNKNKL